MKHRLILVGIGTLISASAMAAGPLYTTDDETPKAVRWNTSNGPIPVYVDGGDVFTYDYDGSVFLTIERAKELTAQGFSQWSNVPSSTFSAEIAGTIEQQTGIADVTGDNAPTFYNQENGYGFWVLYDTDGSILEDYFGVSKTEVLGIAFPEIINENGEILEATVVINGFAVHVNDVNGDYIGGVFTHEFGHALNLSHSQVNGPMVYQSTPSAPRYPGVSGCVEPLFRYDLPASPAGQNADARYNETMFPFIQSSGIAGAEQATVDMPDDIAAISNLYPTPDYLSNTGRISGVIRLKDRNTEFSGLNVIARNISDPMADAVSDMSGSATQGKVGPDGRFTLANLTPGQSYQIYFEEITAGGYPTTPRRALSEKEYWNSVEGTDPAVDLACEASSIIAEAGVTKQADIYMNGYLDGIQFTPLADAFITDLSKNGRVAAGTAGDRAFRWDKNKGFELFPANYRTLNAATDSRGVNFLLGGADPDGNGIGEAALYRKGKGATLLGDLNGNSCGGSGPSGKNASVGWDMDDFARTVVGTAYIDSDNNGVCQGRNEILPFKWTQRSGMEQLSIKGLNNRDWVRAHVISGNGRVILGSDSGFQAVAWVDEQPYNLYELAGASEAYAVNYEGTIVALNVPKQGVVLWHPYNPQAPFEQMGSLRYCYDIPFVSLGGDMCKVDLNRDGNIDEGDWDFIFANSGYPTTLITGMTRDGSLMVGRAGNARSGYSGVIYFEKLGWFAMNDFLERQGVVEARLLGIDNPYGISYDGQFMVGGVAGITSTWYLDMQHAFVCEDGEDLEVPFPRGLVKKVLDGAQMGRCKHVSE